MKCRFHNRETFKDNIPRTQAEDVQARAEAERRLLETIAEAKKMAAAREVKLKAEREEAERKEQEEMWMEAKAVTVAEKQDSCPHSNLWNKGQEKRKYKCGNCGQKRGPTGFKCPHCVLLACQTCVEKLRNRKSNAQHKNGQSQAET
jgi:hypothetical protein